MSIHLPLSEPTVLPSGADPTLMNINFELQSGKLLVIAGPVGAGKSSLLAALMGEMSGANTPRLAGGRHISECHV